MTFHLKAGVATMVGMAGALLAGAGMAFGLTLPKIDDVATLKECGACHLVYSPQLLPQRSWDAIMAHLDTHFGEVATLDETTRLEVLAYLLANAVDAPGSKANSRVLRGVKADDVPTRITTLPWWIGRHEEVNMRNLKSTAVKSAANCLGCHRTADQGVFTE